MGALLMLETTYAQSGSLSKEVALPQEPWEAAIEKLAKKILQEQSPKMAMEVRGNVYELLVDQRNDELKQKAIAAASHFESTMRQGSKDIFHIEAFVLRFMADFKAIAATRK